MSVVTSYLAAVLSVANGASPAEGPAALPVLPASQGIRVGKPDEIELRFWINVAADGGLMKIERQPSMGVVDQPPRSDKAITADAPFITAGWTSLSLKQIPPAARRLAQEGFPCDAAIACLLVGVKGSARPIIFVFHPRIDKIAVISDKVDILDMRPGHPGTLSVESPKSR